MWSSTVSDRADGSSPTVSSPMSARLGLRPAATSSLVAVSTVPSSRVTCTPSPPAATDTGFERQCTAMPSRSNTVAHDLGRVRLLGMQQPRRSARSTDTLVPNRENACASSQPIAPPPMHDAATAAPSRP